MFWSAVTLDNFKFDSFFSARKFLKTFNENRKRQLLLMLIINAINLFKNMSLSIHDF